MARYRVALLLFLVGVALAAASSEIITAAPRVFIRHLDNPLALEAIKTCDGGHGVFTCETGQCHFNTDGHFGCCTHIDHCKPITTCIPGAVSNSDKRCGTDQQCTSCPSKGLSHCMTVRNIGMHQQQIKCTDVPGKRWSDTSFTYDTKSSSSGSGIFTIPVQKTGEDTSETSTSASSSSSSSSPTSSESSASPTAAAIPTQDEPTPTTSPSHTPSGTPVGDQSAGAIPPKVAGAIVVGAVAGAGTLGLGLFLLFRWHRAGRPRPGSKNTEKSPSGILPTRRKDTGKSIMFWKRRKSHDAEAFRELYGAGIRSSSSENENSDVKNGHLSELDPNSALSELHPNSNPSELDPVSPLSSGFRSSITRNPSPPPGTQSHDWAHPRSTVDASSPGKPTDGIYSSSSYSVGPGSSSPSGMQGQDAGVELSAYPNSSSNFHSSSLITSTPTKNQGGIAEKMKHSSSPPYTTTPTPVSPIFSGPGILVPRREVGSGRKNLIAGPSSVADLAFVVAGRGERESDGRQEVTGNGNEIDEGEKEKEQEQEQEQKPRPSSLAALNFDFPSSVSSLAAAATDTPTTVTLADEVAVAAESTHAAPSPSPSPSPSPDNQHAHAHTYPHPASLIPGHLRTHRPNTSVITVIPSSSRSPSPQKDLDEREKQKQKSSQLLSVAGPYLTAEQALGGYWEAEREQLEADKAAGLGVVEKQENDGVVEGEAKGGEKDGKVGVGGGEWEK